MFSIEQFPLNFGNTALEPYMSARTIEFHYGKHLATYISNLNGLAAGTKYESMPLEKIISESSRDASATKIFNNAAQAFNHDFFFRGLAKDSKTAFPREISVAFGSDEKFIAAFKDSAMAVFGSGWTWLAKDGGNLKIINTANADTPIAYGMEPILALDVWEHAYYLDYQNKRADFVDAFLGHLINRDFIAKNLGL